MVQWVFHTAILAVVQGTLLRSIGAAARPLEGGLPQYRSEVVGGRHLLANIEHEELRHLSRGLRAANNTFSYGEYDGYKDWGGICQQGNKIPQSPINVPAAKIKAARAMPTGELDFSYANLTGATAMNTGHGVQVNMPKGNFLTVGQEKWQMLQYHFHSPSEHALSGRLAAMEIHMVHSNEAGDLAVVGLLMSPNERVVDQSPYSSALAQGLENVPKTVSEESDPFTLNVDTFSSLLAAADGLPDGASAGAGKVPAVTYTGSLTTPPCTAGVQWYVLVNTTPVGPGQVLRFQRFLGNGTTLSQNIRPVQPSLGRDISVTMVPGKGMATSPTSGMGSAGGMMSPDMAPNSGDSDSEDAASPATAGSPSAGGAAAAAGVGAAGVAAGATQAASAGGPSAMAAAPAGAPGGGAAGATAMSPDDGSDSEDAASPVTAGSPSATAAAPAAGGVGAAGAGATPAASAGSPSAAATAPAPVAGATVGAVSPVTATAPATVATAPAAVATAPAAVATAPAAVATAPAAVATAPAAVATAPAAVVTAPATVATAPATVAA